jgi:WD40 repeat protein
VDLKKNFEVIGRRERWKSWLSGYRNRELSKSGSSDSFSSRILCKAVILYGLGFFLGASPAGQAKATGRVAANTQQVKPATSAPGNEEHEKPELVLQTGHAYAPLMLAFSADSRLVASADWYPSTGDGTIKLWEVATGRQLRTLSGHTGAIFALVFSPVKEILASSGDDGTIRIWNVVTGRELHRVYARAHVLYFSPDGKYLASLANTNAYQGEDREPDPELETCPHADKPGFCEAQQLNVWDVQGGRFLYTIPPPPFEELKAGNAWSFGFSPDEKTLASALPGKPVNFREVSSGRELPAIEGVNGAFAYDSAGKRIVAHDGNGTLAIWDVTNRKRLTTVQDSGDPLVFSTDRNLIVTMAATKEQRELRSLDATTGEMRAERRVSETYKGTEVRFGDKGKWAAAGAWGDGKIVLWNYMDGGAVPQVWKGLELPAAFSPDGKWAAATTESRLFSFIDLKNGKEICTTASPLGAVSGVAVSATTRVLASGDGTAVDLWDLKAGLVSGSLDARRDLMSPLFFTPDEKTLFSIDQPPNIGARWVSGGDTGDLVVAENYERNTTNCGGAPPDVQSGTPTETGAGTIPTWNIATGQLEYKFGGWAPVAMSADGKTLVTGAASRSDMQPVIATDVWNVERGNLVAEFVEPKIENRNPLAGDRVNVLAISSDGKLAAVATRAFEHPVISIWDITSRKQIAALEGHTDSITDLDFDSTGSVLASSSLDHTVKLWDLAHANKIRCSISTGEVPGGVSFGRDGQSLVVAEDDEAVRYQAWNCDPVRSYIGHGNTIRGIQSTSDDALLFTGSDDGSSRIWDRRSGELLATLVTLHGGADWMVVAPNGLFDGSPGAWSQMLWRFGGNTFDVAPAEIFFNEFYYPGLLAEIVAGKRPAAPSDITRKDRRQPEVKLEVAGATAGSATGDSHSVTLKVEVHAIAADNKHAHSSGVRDVRLFRNDSLVRMWHGEMKVDASGRGGLETTVKMVAGENKFTAYAFNDDNIKSSDASEIVRGDFPNRSQPEVS